MGTEMDYYAKNCELVLALVCPVGINLDDVQSRLNSIFRQFNYSTNLIHLSKVASQIDTANQTNADNEMARLDRAMELGNKLRAKVRRGDLMALLAIKEINRLHVSGEDEQPGPRKRTVHIIRSLKHADEAETLRQIYGSGFFLLGISSSIDSRKTYLKELKGISDDSDVSRLISRDDKENNPLGQQTRNVFELSDAFVTTDGEDSLEKQLTRVVELLFSKPTVPPTAQEYAMFMAYAASLRSADLARQVGAVIVNSYGDITSTGANDVPAYGGGLYWPGPNDQRDYITGGDSNEIEKSRIAEDVVKRVLGDAADQQELSDAMDRLRGSKLMNITEYGRAVHAEMEALLAAARNGVSVRNGLLYTTTYPCHNCAKHIIAAGIKTVIFIEPYPKSYATVLHSDAISNDGKSHESKVQFRQFVGIGPRRFIDLFSMRLSSGRTLVRKQNGKVVDWSRSSAELRVPMTPLSYLDAEVALVTELSDALEGVDNG